MKLLVFAHKPPPHHGQSYMVQLLLEALGGDARRARRRAGPAPALECYHVDCRVSRDTEDVGRPRWGKLFLVLKYCLEAVWCRLWHGVTHFYCVPAFPARAPVYRDWIALGLGRLLFRKVIYHWHAVGLSEWLEKEARPWERWISRRIYARPDLSIIVRPSNQTDPFYFESKRTEVVLNGIPDPCPDFGTRVLGRRRARVTARRKLLAREPLTAAEQEQAGSDPQIYRVVFMSLCYRGKGLFDTVEAVELANRRLGKSSPVWFRLTVAGTFWLEEEQREFDQRVRQAELTDYGPVVDYLGFVSGEEKQQLLCESDCLCFPTYMAESFGLVLVEAMARGLPLITTNWRNIPELLPPDYPGVVEPQSPDQIAAKLIEFLRRDYDPTLRGHFVEHYTDTKFGERIRSVLGRI